MLKAILFDLDGVLIKTEHETFKFYQKYLKGNHNIILKDSDFSYKAGRKSRDFFDAVLTPDQQKEVNTEQLISLKRQEFNNKLEQHVEKIPHAHEVIKKLYEQNFRLAITSQNEAQMIASVLNWLEITDYFEIILSLDDITHKKPNPEIYTRAAEKLNLSTDECLVIEDSFDGIHAAKNGNFRCLALYHGYMPQETYDAADDVIQELPELFNHL